MKLSKGLALLFPLALLRCSDAASSQDGRGQPATGAPPDAKVDSTTPLVGGPEGGLIAANTNDASDASERVLQADAANAPDARGGDAHVPGTPCTSPPPVKIIFDTDIGPDCDDAGGLAMLHAMADRCELEILGMMSSTSYEWGAGALDAMNTYYGRPDIPIGTLKESGFLDSSSYTQYIAQNFPNDLKSGKNAPDAVTLFRDLLTAQPDASVTIVSVGPLRNARNLLRSPGGRDLVATKVKEWVVMGGWGPTHADGEWNFVQDGAASREAVENWPTPIMFSGAEVGGGISTGTRLFSETDQKNPVRKAYQLYPAAGDAGRPSWDLTAVLYAGRGLGPYFKSVIDGYNEVSVTGANSWHSTPNRHHSYLVGNMPSKTLGWAMDDLVVHADSDRYPKTAPLPKVGWKATANPGNNIAASAVDGDYESQWSTGRAMVPGDWIAVDMGAAQRIDRIELDSHWSGRDYPRGYELYFSNDGSSWGSPIKAGQGAATTIISFLATSTQYLKVVQTTTLTAENQSTGAVWLLRELSVFLEGP